MTQTGRYIKPSEKLPGRIIRKSSRKWFRVFQTFRTVKLNQSGLKGTKVRTTACMRQTGGGGVGAALLTLETVSGMLKSFPPCSLKPQGPGPGRDTV